MFDNTKFSNEITHRGYENIYKAFIAFIRGGVDVGSYNTFRKWVAGKSEPSATQLQQICAYLDVPISYFFTNKNSKTQ